ncbi:MAG: glycoside hydrolase family 10 protein [Candidatus Sumerlaeaceae bacterium]
MMATVAPAASLTSGTLEPGQAEAQTTLTQPVQLPAQWSHPKTEARAVWITSQELQESKEALTAKLDQVASANFNTITVDTWFRGFVAYPDSALVPQYPGVVEKNPDVLSWILKEAHARKLRVDAWPSYGFYAYYTKDAAADESNGPLLDKHPDLTSLDADGKAPLHNPSLGDFYSLCPANPKSHQLLAQLISEMVEKYEFDGVNLDRMRFPSSSYCHCAWCKEHFREDVGIELRRFPDGSEEARKFLEWKREQNARSIGVVHRAVRKLRPRMPITAYVVGPAEKDDKAQSWELWVKRGYIDAVAVSMYGPDIRETAKRALQLLDGRKDKLICAISCDLPHSSYYLRNIQFAREITPTGQFTWYGGKLLDDVEPLKAGPYAEPAAWPLLLSTK